MTPSFRLRALAFGMRLIEKPKLARGATPASANRDFEMMAPVLFRPPRGCIAVDEGSAVRITCGDPVPDRAMLYLRGGAFVTGSRRSYGGMAGRLAKRTGATVFMPDYPKAQEDTFPAAPRAVLRAWDWLLGQGWAPHQIVIAGDSAGGNLVFGLLAEVLQRGERPAGVLAFSPWTDLTLSGDSIVANADIDPLIPVSRMQEAVDFYLGGADPTDPRASPIFADFPDPPPVLIQVGSREVLFSDSKRMAERLGGTLDVWDHVFHGWQMFDPRLPEAREAMRKAADFVQTCFESARR